jgi:hypothetical protein
MPSCRRGLLAGDQAGAYVRTPLARRRALHALVRADCAVLGRHTDVRGGIDAERRVRLVRHVVLVHCQMIVVRTISRVDYIQPVSGRGSR